MNLPDKCPFCGAEPYTTASGDQCRGGDRWVLFCCDTAIHAGQDLRRTQSRKCEDAERARLAARVAELEARCKRLEEAVSAYQAAYEPDGHVRPHDCFATGPKTGDPIQDLVACPGCFAARKAKEAKP